MRGFVVLQALAVVMAEHHGALRAAGVVLASMIGVVGKGGAVRLGAGEDAMAVGLVAPAIDDFALLREIVLLVELVVGAMEIGDAGCDNHALDVLPRALA